MNRLDQGAVYLSRPDVKAIRVITSAGELSMPMADLVAMIAEQVASAVPPLVTANTPPVAVQDLIQIVAPTTGQTVIAAAGSTTLLLDPAGLLATLTVQLPQTPANGQRWCIASSAAITLLALSGGQIKGTLTSLVANGWARFIYSSSASAWFRTG